MYLDRYVVSSGREGQSWFDWPPLLRTSLKIHGWVDSDGGFLFYISICDNGYNAALTNNSQTYLYMTSYNRTHSALVSHLVLMET